MPVTDRFDDEVRRAAAEVLDMPESRLGPCVSLGSVRAGPADMRMILQRAAQETGADLNAIVESMPVYAFRYGDATMASLRWLSGLSRRAARLLERSTVRPVDDTLESIAASLRGGKYVDSGLRGQPSHPANSFWRTLRWGLVPLALVVIYCALISLPTFLSPPSGPLPWWFALARMVGAAWYHRVPVGMFLAVWYGFLLVPGLVVLWREGRLAAARRRDPPWNAR